MNAKRTFWNLTPKSECVNARQDFCIHLLYLLILYYSHFILSELPFILLDVFQLFYAAVLVSEWHRVCVCARACRCVFMQCVAAYSLMYLYFSPSVQASLLLHQSSIFQIKWS